MKVMHVVDSLRVGGSESLAATLADAFVGRGVEGVVCGIGEDGPLRVRLGASGVESLHMGRSSGVRPDVMARLGWLMLRKQCDAVITHHFRQLVHAAPGTCLLRRKLVHVEHDHHSYESKPSVLAHLSRLSPLVHRFVFVSEQIRDWYVGRVASIEQKSVVIPNGVDTVRFSRVVEARERIRMQIGASEDDFVVGTCARLEAVKDLGLLISGFAILAKADHLGRGKARLVLVGAGSLRPVLEEMVRQEGLAGQVHFAGVVDDVQDWLSGFDAYAITSRNEGLPLSVMEAMSCGLPVVATDVGSIWQVVDDEVGALMESRAPEELGARLGSLADDRAACVSLGRAARARIVRGHSVESMVSAYVHALGGGHGGRVA